MDITIKMRRPFADMDYYGSFPQFTAIPEAKDNPETYGQHPLATGPYKFADYKPGTSLTLVKNDQWDPETDPGRIQMVDGWEFKFAQDTAKLENIILNDNGSAQTTLTYDNVSASSYRQIAQDKERLVTGTNPCTFMWYLDMTKIKDIRVRQAIGYAYPYVDAWKAAGEIVGVTRVPGTAILPPGTAGRKEFDVLGTKGEETDPERATPLLEEADAEGFEIKFLFATDDDAAVAAKDAIVKGLEAAGFKATPIASNVEKIRTDRTDYNSPINVRSTGWCSDWPTGATWFPAQWAGNLVGLGGHAQPGQLQGEGDGPSSGQDPGHHAPEEALEAWGEFDQKMQEELLPGGRDRLRRRGDDPRLQGRRHGQRQRPRDADVLPDVHHRVTRVGRPVRGTTTALTGPWATGLAVHRLRGTPTGHQGPWMELVSRWSPAT